MASLTDFDIGPLTWVKGEIDQALARSLTALRAFAANPNDTAQIRFSQTHFHQAHGALQIVGLDGVARFSEELEGLIGDIGTGKARPSALPAAERAFNAISSLLEQLLAGQPYQPLRLFSLYREIAAERGSAEPDPVDLYFPDVSSGMPRLGGQVSTLDYEEWLGLVRAERARFQRGLLRWLKREVDGAHEMHAAVKAIGASEGAPAARAFWWAAGALLEAMSEGSIREDTGLMRLCNRIERQMKRMLDGSTSIAERLLREVLFHAARAPGTSPRLREVQQAFGLEGSIPETFELKVENAQQLPRLRAMREVVAAAKTAWTKYTAGHAPSIAPFTEQAVLLRDRSASLGRWELSRLAEELVAISDGLVGVAAGAPESLAIEVATALLLIEDSIDRFSTLPPQFGQQCQAMIARLRHVRGEPIEGPVPSVPALDEVARRAQERMAIAQLVTEVQSNLREIENTLDAYFRDPAKRAELGGLERPIGQILGAFRMLNDVRAEQVLRDCAALMRRFAEPSYRPAQSDFEYVAGLLSGLGFYTDALQHGKADFDAAMQPVRARAAPTVAAPPDRATVEAQLAQHVNDARALLAAWSEVPAEPARRIALQRRIETIQADAALVANGELERRAQFVAKLLAEPDASPVRPELMRAIAELVPEPPAAPVTTPEARKLAAGPAAAVDAELLEVYLIEAEEVLETIRVNANLAREQPNNGELLRPVRRSFHTLKGSGRMVGLTRLSEAAWAVEKLLNGWLENEKPVTEPLLEAVAAGEQLFRDAVAALKAGRELPNERAVIEKAASVTAEAPGIVVGSRRIAPALYQIFLSEARTHLDTMRRAIGGLAADDERRAEFSRAAHTLGGICGTVGFPAVRELALVTEQAAGGLESPGEDSGVLSEAVDALESMVRAVAEQREPGERPDVITRLGPLAARARSAPQMEDEPAAELPAEVEPEPFARPEAANLPSFMPVLDEAGAEAAEVAPAEATPAEVSPSGVMSEEERAELVPDIGAEALPESWSAWPTTEPQELEPQSEPVPELVEATREEQHEPVAAFPPAIEPVAESAEPPGLKDDLDPQLLSVFLEEAHELVPAIGGALRDWRDAEGNVAAGGSLQRLLHTLKGSARMAGAMRLGEMLHHMETRVEGALSNPPLPPLLFDELEAQYDQIGWQLDRLQEPSSSQAAAPAAIQPVLEEVAPAPIEAAPRGAVPLPPREARPLAAAAEPERASVLRVRADSIDKLVNQAGEVAIARSRIEGEVKSLKTSLGELTENVNRLRSQLREIEIQADLQIQSRMAQAAETEGQFDPLEFDRYTRFQELTRMLAEGVNDVATVQLNVTRSLDETESALLAQARLSRQLQHDLLRVRMVAFRNVGERLYRVVRQTAKELGKRAVLDMRGGQVELDRSVLERITAPFEHMLRNAVAHGLESAAERRAAGKSEVGEIRVDVRQEGNDIILTVADDGAGLDLDRIRDKGIALGLIRPEDEPPESEIAELIFRPGFTTVEEVTQLAGRGVGMDVVKSEISALGGRIELAYERGRGTQFTIYLPLTLAVTQGLLVRAGKARYVVPAATIDQVRQVRAEELAECYRTRVASWQDRRVGFHYLPRLLGDSQSIAETQRLSPILFVRSGTNAIAIHVDQMYGNQEVVVKNIGPLLARVAGITGATVLGSGEIVLIINPVILASRETAAAAMASGAAPEVPAEIPPPLAMVVDDSLTVRRATGRLLEREGYRVVTARDGVEAMELLQEMVPDVMLVDIEMPRMDGFDLTRNVRADRRLKHVPIIMITSRTAEKHRTYAREIGVNAYLGKPYHDEELLALVTEFLRQSGVRPPGAESRLAAPH